MLINAYIEYAGLEEMTITRLDMFSFSGNF